METFESPIINKPTPKLLWTAGLLIYPNKVDEDKKNKTYRVKDCEPMAKALDHADLKLFKGVFGENTAPSVEAFFQSTFISEVWPEIASFLKKSHCFSKGEVNQTYLHGYASVERQMKGYSPRYFMPNWFH